MNKRRLFSLLTLALIASLLILNSCSDNKTVRALTQQELHLLQIREQQQSSIIISDKPEELRLLHSRSREIDFGSPHLDMLISQMRKAVIAHRGLGLAAVQIGIPVRVVLMQQQVDQDNIFKVFINPEILHKSPSTQVFLEGCLSLPNNEDHFIERSLGLTVSYQTLNGQTVAEDFVGLDAAVFQQEMDHLDGILIRDYPDIE